MNGPGRTGYFWFRGTIKGSFFSGVLLVSSSPARARGLGGVGYGEHYLEDCQGEWLELTEELLSPGKK